MAQDVAAIIVTHNRRDILARALRDLRAQSAPPAAIIVVDNCSQDGTADYVRGSFPSVYVVESPDNTGFAGGVTIGLRTACELGYSWSWVFNDDDTPTRNALERLLEVLRTLPQDVGMLAPARVDSHGKPFTLGSRWRGRHLHLDWHDSLSDPVALDIVAFSGTLMSMAMVRDVGLPRADFFMMLEELEFCLRTREKGWRVFVVPDFLVCAEAMGSSERVPPWRGYYQTRNHLLMVRDRHSLIEGYWWLLRTIKSIVAALMRGPDRRARVAMRVRGIVDGARGVTGRSVDPPAMVAVEVI